MKTFWDGFEKQALKIQKALNALTEMPTLDYNVLRKQMIKKVPREVGTLNYNDLRREAQLKNKITPAPIWRRALKTTP